ncbi:MAG: hypothetical protein PHQ64_03625 [Bacilli bacterium]|nr:hypothetical protein [Bacilli bacterium]
MKINLKDKKIFIPIIVLGGIIVLSGIVYFLGDKVVNPLFGTWETSYELGMYGKVKQSYTFNSNKTCEKVLVTDRTITKKCKYEFDGDNKIKVTFDDKGISILTYRKEGKGYVIDGYMYEKK